MKTLIFLLIVLVFLCAFYRYIEIDTRNFINSLLQPPGAVEQPPNKGTTHQDV